MMPSRRSTAVWGAIAAVAVVLLMFTSLVQQQRQGKSDRRISDLERQLSLVLKALDQEQTAARDRGQEPVAPPAQQLAKDDDSPAGAAMAGPKGDRGEKGRDGAPGPPPSDDQVRRAVAGFLAANPPAPGRPPTGAEIDAAVAAYCARDGACRGADGVAGKDGKDGRDGVPGPAPSDAQVAAGVMSFCAANNNCVGPAGRDGRDGVDGSNGRDGIPGPAVRSWTFPVGHVTYSCSDPNGDLAYECVAQPPPS